MRPYPFITGWSPKGCGGVYDLLQDVRLKGDWEAWLAFLLEGVIETPEQGVASAPRLVALFEADRQRISTLGRAASSALRLHGALQRAPLLGVPAAASKPGLSQPTVQKSLEHLQELGIVQEITGKLRSRLYRFTSYLRILDEGTEPLQRRAGSGEGGLGWGARPVSEG